MSMSESRRVLNVPLLLGGVVLVGTAVAVIVKYYQQRNLEAGAPMADSSSQPSDSPPNKTIERGNNQEKLASAVRSMSSSPTRQLHLGLGEADPLLLEAAKKCSAAKAVLFTWTDTMTGLAANVEARAAVPRGVSRGSASVAISFSPVTTTDALKEECDNFLHQFDFKAKFINAPASSDVTGGVAPPAIAEEQEQNKRLLDHAIRQEILALQRDGFAVEEQRGESRNKPPADAAAAAVAFCEYVQLYLPQPLSVSSAALVASRVSRAPPTAWEYVYVLEGVRRRQQQETTDRRSIIFIFTPAAFTRARVSAEHSSGCSYSRRDRVIYSIGVHHKEHIQWSKPAWVIRKVVLPAFIRFEAPAAQSSTGFVVSEPRGGVGFRISGSGGDTLLLSDLADHTAPVEIFGLRPPSAPAKQRSSKDHHGHNMHHTSALAAPPGSPDPVPPRSFSASSSMETAGSPSPRRSAEHPHRVRVIKARRLGSSSLARAGSPGVFSASASPARARSLQQGARAVTAAVVHRSDSTNASSSSSSCASMHLHVASGFFFQQQTPVHFRSGYDFSFNKKSSSNSSSNSVETIVGRSVARVLTENKCGLAAVCPRIESVFASAVSGITLAEASLAAAAAVSTTASAVGSPTGAGDAVLSLQLVPFDKHAVELCEAVPLFVGGWCAMGAVPNPSPKTAGAVRSDDGAAAAAAASTASVVGCCLFAMPNDTLTRLGVHPDAMEVLRCAMNSNNNNNKDSDDTVFSGVSDSMVVPSHSWFCVTTVVTLPIAGGAAAGAADHGTGGSVGPLLLEQLREKARRAVFEPIWKSFSVGRAAIDNAVSHGGVEYSLAVLPSLRCVLQRFSSQAHPVFRIDEPPSGNPTAVLSRLRSGNIDAAVQSPFLDVVTLRLKQSSSVREVFHSTFGGGAKPGNDDDDGGDDDAVSAMAAVAASYRQRWVQYQLSSLRQQLGLKQEGGGDGTASLLVVEQLSCFDNHRNSHEERECEREPLRGNTVIATMEEMQYQHLLKQQTASRDSGLDLCVFPSTRITPVAACFNTPPPPPLAAASASASDTSVSVKRCRFVAFILLPPLVASPSPSTVPIIAQQSGPELMDRQLMPSSDSSRRSSERDASGTSQACTALTTQFHPDVDCGQQLVLEVHSSPFDGAAAATGVNNSFALDEFVYFLKTTLKFVQ